MKKLVILFISIMLVAPIFAQESKKEQRKAEKEAKKEEKARQGAEAAAIMKATLESKQFVLEADFLADKRGQRIMVQPNLNFIGVDGDKGAFQFGNGKDVGYNGLGGLTVEGRMQDFELKETKNGSMTVNFRIISSMGNIFVNINVNPGGKADATARGNSSAVLKYTGEIVPLSSSTVYKGARSL